jgi:hypothetical protein
VKCGLFALRENPNDKWLKMKYCKKHLDVERTK